MAVRIPALGEPLVEVRPHDLADARVGAHGGQDVGALLGLDPQPALVGERLHALALGLLEEPLPLLGAEVRRRAVDEVDAGLRLAVEGVAGLVEVFEGQPVACGVVVGGAEVGRDAMP
jgi:hypothetical protein